MAYGVHLYETSYKIGCELAERVKLVLRPVVWIGDARKNIRSFPPGAQKEMGDELQVIQFGGMPKNAKPFKGIGSGILEIALAFEKNAYRTVLAVQLGESIYILHAFQKKAKSGIKTPQKGC